MPLTKGELNLATAKRCTFKGAFVIEKVEFAIEHMTLALDKLAGHGVGTARNKSDRVILTDIIMVRQLDQGRHRKLRLAGLFDPYHQARVPAPANG